MALIRRTEGREPAPRFEGVFGRDPWAGFENLLRWDPFRAAISPSFFGEGMAFVPTVEVKETSDAFEVKADLPGVAEKEVEVTLTGNMLRISGKREEETREDTDEVHIAERRYGAFTRSFTLPENADVDKLDAKMKEGVLNIRVPKRAEAKPKKVEVKS